MGRRARPMFQGHEASREREEKNCGEHGRNATATRPARQSGPEIGVGYKILWAVLSPKNRTLSVAGPSRQEGGRRATRDYFAWPRPNASSSRTSGGSATTGEPPFAVPRTRNGSWNIELVFM